MLGNWTRYDYTAGVLTATRHFTAATTEAAMLAATVGNDSDSRDADYTFDTQGRPDTAATFTGTGGARVEFTKNKLHYNAANLAVDKEDITVDPDGTGSIPALARTLDRRQDSLLRSQGWDLKNGAAIEHSNTYTWHATHGRLQTVSALDGSSFAYGYTPNAGGLIAAVTGSAHTVTNTWLANQRKACPFVRN